MPNEDQIEYWNSEAAAKWVSHADALDGMLAPFLKAVLDEACPVETETVLDIGCGAGALSLAALDKVGSGGSVTGIDVSRPLLDLARRRAQGAAGTINFEEADASIYRAGQPVDCAVSRFGVMFFDDPQSAFASLRRSLRPEGRMVFACWQAPDQNEWASLPIRVAMPFLSAPPERPPEGAPGPFAFANPDRVRSILEAAGWKGVEISDWKGMIDPPGETPADMASFMLKLGPLSRLLQAEADKLGAVEAELTTHLASLSSADAAIRLGAAAWIVSAVAS